MMIFGIQSKIINLHKKIGKDIKELLNKIHS